MPTAILVADDDPDILGIVAMALENQGHTVYKACNGREAVDGAREHQPDLVLMDMMMPKVDGYEAMRIIKSQHPSIPIIAQTAYTMNNDRHRCLEAGFNDYIAKPINRLALYRMVNENLS